MFGAVRKRLSRRRATTRVDLDAIHTVVGSVTASPPDDDDVVAVASVADDPDQADKWQQILDTLVLRAKNQSSSSSSYHPMQSDTSSGFSPRTVDTSESATDSMPVVRSEPLGIDRVESRGPDGGSPVPNSPDTLTHSFCVTPNTGSSTRSGSKLSTSTGSGGVRLLRRSYSSGTLASSVQSSSQRGWAQEMQMHGYGVSPDTQKRALDAHRRRAKRHTDGGPMFVRLSPDQI